jgi:CubicO group peptidase (beta-lactamase class C family)
VTALASLAGWPVGCAAAAVVTPAGVIDTAGDIHGTFRLASVTKPLAALATLVAVEEGALELDSALTGEIGEMLPGATLRHLLAHASGLGPERRHRAADPGTRRIYSNAGYELIGERVEAETGIGFGDYLRDAVFRPLAMTDAALNGSPAKDASAAVTDLTALLAELLGPGRLLHPTTLADAVTTQFPGLRGVLPGYGPQQHNDWGLGFEVRDDKQPHWTSPRNSPRTYGHFGQSGTMFWIDPDAGVGLVALADRDFGEWAIAAWPALSDAVLDAYGA